MPASGSSHGTLTIYTSVDTKGLQSGLNGITKTFNKLSSAMKMSVGIAGMLALGKSAVDAASDLQEYRNVAEVTFGNLIYMLDNLTRTSIEAYGMSKLMATQAASGFMAMGNAAGIARKESAEMAIGLTEYMADFASFYNLSHERARTALAAVYTGETETLKQYGIMLQEVNLQQFENERGLGRSIKTMTAAEKAQLRYNYIMFVGKDAVGDFARTSDNWANQVRVLTERWKELLIQLGNGLITVLTPLVKVMNSLIDVTMRYTKVLGEAIATIFGIEWQDLSKQHSDAADSAYEYADAEEAIADATGASSKAASKALQSFDKLNVIRTDEGLGDGPTIPTINTDNIEDSAGEIEESSGIIQSAIDTLFKLGQYMAQSLQDTLDSIDWTLVYDKLSDFGTGVAEYLNGALSTDALSSVATTFANSLNSVIKSALGFGEELNWVELGDTLGDAINTFFNDFDFKEFAHTINVWVDGLKTALIHAIQRTDWSAVASSVAEFFKEIEVDTVALIIGFITIKHVGHILVSSLGHAIGKAITTQIVAYLGTKPVLSVISAALKAAFGSKAARSALIFMFPKTASAIHGLVDRVAALLKSAFGSKAAQSSLVYLFPKTAAFISGIKEVFALTAGGAGTLSESMAAVFGTTATVVSGVIGTVTGAITAIFNFIKMLKDGFSWLNEVLMILGTALAAVGAVILGAPAAVAAAVAAVVAAIMTAVVAIKDNWESIKTFFSNLWSSISEFATNAWETTKGVWKTVANWFDTYVIQPVSDFFVGLTTRIGQVFEGCWIIIQAVWTIVSEWFSDNVAEPVKKVFEDVTDAIGGFFSAVWTGIKDVWSTVANWFEKYVTTPVANFFQAAVDKIGGFFSDLWEGIKKVWSTVSNWFTQYVTEPVQRAWKIATDAIGGFFSSLWSSIVVGVTSAMNGMIGAIESALNWIIGGINDVISGFNDVVEWAADVINVDWGGVDLIDKVKFNRISIPKLATGAVIPPNRQFLALLGDQKHGTNVEAPLDTIKQALAEVMAQYGGTGERGDIVIQISGREIARVVREEDREHINRTGNSMFAY